METGETKRTYLLYGVPGVKIDDARVVVEHSLGITMVPHDSMYLGGTYYSFVDGESKIELRPNHDFDPEPLRRELAADASLIDIATVQGPEHAQGHYIALLEPGLPGIMLLDTYRG